MKRIYKFATGETPPDGAIYLSTITQTHYDSNPSTTGGNWCKCWLVWHYFLVDVKE